MGITLNMVGGGKGLDSSDALLVVTVPTGFSVIAAKGGLTLAPTIWQTADVDHDCALFSIPARTFDANDWTVTATLGTLSATGTIVIDSAEEYEMSLDYRTWLYKAGDQSGWTALAWKGSSSWTAAAPTISYQPSTLNLTQNSSNSGIVYCNTAVNLPTVSTITAHGNFEVHNSACGLYIMPNTTVTGTYPNESLRKNELEIGTYTDYELTLDISGVFLSGVCYIAFGLVKTGNGGTTFVIDEVYYT